jgi:hypothetical protein
MKKNFTSSFYAKNLAVFLFFCTPFAVTAQVLFSQGFSTGTTISSYQGAGANQFDFIGPTAGTSSANIGATLADATYTNKLRIYRFGGAYAFARTTDFSPTPSILKVKFKLHVHSISTAVTTAAVFYVGENLTADAVGGESAKSHSRVEIGFVTTGGTATITTPPVFSIKNGTPTNYNGGSANEYEVTWYINNSGTPINYADPLNMGTALGDDKADVWVGTTRILSDVAATTADKPLTDLKFLFSGGGGVIVVDDIEVSTGANVIIPVTLSKFTANKAGAINQLTWTTETEVNNKGYDVQRQTANGSWETLGFVKGAGNASTYTFEDKTPLSISYYRLRQMDYDGKESLSKVVSVSQTQKGQIRIAPNPASDKVNITLPDNDRLESTTIMVYDLAGKLMLTQKTTTKIVELDMSSLAKGTYLVKVDTNNTTYTEKITRL